MEEPVVETMADNEKKKSHMPIIIGAAAAVVLVIIAWFVVLLPNDDDEEQVAKDTKEQQATPTPAGTAVTQPIVVISESDGVISAREVRPLVLDNGQYIYVVPFETPNKLVDARRAPEDNNRVFGYTYVPEY
jgi:hypothetical protein